MNITIANQYLDKSNTDYNGILDNVAKILENHCGKFIINKYLKPLSKNFAEALNLSDDAAVLKNLKNKNLVVSVDNFIYGIHCPDYIGISSAVNRAILAAVSDLSAMAAKPYCIFISITLNKGSISTKLLKGLQQGISKALKSTKTIFSRR